MSRFQNFAHQCLAIGHIDDSKDSFPVSVIRQFLPIGKTLFEQHIFS